MRRVALSFDLDGERHYRRIHGLKQLPAGAVSFLSVAIERALQLAQRLELPLTFFVVTEDLAQPQVRQALERAVLAGHSLESHSRSHPYDLSRLGPAQLDDEVAGSFDDLERSFGVRPRGFRAPGYTLSAALFDALERAGAAFDASLLPSPPYALAKLGVQGLHALRGRRSASLAFAGSQLWGPTTVHRPGPAPGSRGQRPFVEIPMAVTPFARLPVIGTSLLQSERLGRRLLAACDPQQALSLEFHAIDLIEAGEGASSSLRALEPALRVPLAKRLGLLETLVGELRTQGSTFTRLMDLAQIAETGC
jgi:hypothetical protein